MDAIEFMQNIKRRCVEGTCAHCPMDNFGFCNQDLPRMNNDEIEKFVKDIDEWVTEHPVKLMQDYVFENFPKAIKQNGILAIKPCDMNGGEEFRKTHCRVYNGSCYDCRKDYWLGEVE